MKIWVDDIRPAPDGYVWIKSVNDFKLLAVNLLYWKRIDILDMDHDAGDYRIAGGDYIEILNYIEELQYKYPPLSQPITVHIHSMNPVGVANMRRIIQRNGWIEV